MSIVRYFSQHVYLFILSNKYAINLIYSSKYIVQFIPSSMLCKKWLFNLSCSTLGHHKVNVVFIRLNKKCPQNRFVTAEVTTFLRQSWIWREGVLSDSKGDEIVIHSISQTQGKVFLKQ